MNHFSRSEATLQKWVKRHTRPTGAVRIRAVGTSIKYSNLCMPTCPFRLAGLGTSLRIRGGATAKEERNYSFCYLNTLLTISLAEFFAKSHSIFFSSIIILILPSAQEWRQRWITFLQTKLTGYCHIEERGISVSCPRTRGKCQPTGWRKGQVWAET